MRGYHESMLLSILKESDNYGYMISKEIALRSKGEYIVKEATLYAVLARLEKRNFVSSYRGAITNGKERTYFKITNDGIDYLNEKSSEWKVTKRIIGSFLKWR